MPPSWDAVDVGFGRHPIGLGDVRIGWPEWTSDQEIRVGGPYGRGQARLLDHVHCRLLIGVGDAVLGFAGFVLCWAANEKEHKQVSLEKQNEVWEVFSGNA